MLSDLHLHLRPDDLSATAAEYFTPANVERYREVAEDRGIAELGVAEHIHRFSQALEIWEHPFWREQAVDDIYAYCEFVRTSTDLRLGLEVDFVPGREDRTQNLIDRLELDYVVGSVHFVGDFAVDHGDYDIWTSGRSAREVWRRYFETVGEAARSGLFDILAHPDLVKVWGGARPQPDGDLRRFYEPAVEGIAESGIAVEVSTAGLRKAAGECYPAPALLEMCLEAGAPIALSSDAHLPGDVGRDYPAALELLEELGVGELCVFERRVRRLEAIG
ncbi:MAG: histidinol-phosphatase family [Solirubrobacteraceae bacterium]|nr:histidinol-phosphatase family [Solirubrobacteraceae bacterium]